MYYEPVDVGEIYLLVIIARWWVVIQRNNVQLEYLNFCSENSTWPYDVGISNNLEPRSDPNVLHAGSGIGMGQYGHY